MSTALTMTPTPTPTTTEPIMMNPFELLSQKPEPQAYAIPPFSTNSKENSQGSTELSPAEAKTTSIHYLLQDLQSCTM